QPGDGIRVSQVLCPPRGTTSPVKHVIYIVTENKTFDQYFGDLTSGGYDADPSWVLYGQPVTTNHHALANRFSLGDRFFSDAEVSVTGHSWTSGAIATEHNERTWQADYDNGIRGTHGGGVMPNFIYMSLPVNHTLGTNLGSPTPASMVADNDYAIGLIVDALSKSPFWESTVVMQAEDDTQLAGDHISPLRTYLEVSG